MDKWVEKMLPTLTPEQVKAYINFILDDNSRLQEYVNNLNEQVEELTCQRDSADRTAASRTQEMFKLEETLKYEVNLKNSFLQAREAAYKHTSLTQSRYREIQERYSKLQTAAHRLTSSYVKHLFYCFKNSKKSSINSRKCICGLQGLLDEVDRLADGTMIYVRDSGNMGY